RLLAAVLLRPQRWALLSAHRVLPAAGGRRRGRARRLRGGLRGGGRRGLLDGLAHSLVGRAPARRDPRLAPRPLPAGPAVALAAGRAVRRRRRGGLKPSRPRVRDAGGGRPLPPRPRREGRQGSRRGGDARPRSEEHTSELQSLAYLV